MLELSNCGPLIFVMIANPGEKRETAFRSDSAPRFGFDHVDQERSLQAAAAVEVA
jgi:hypothetical protein